MVAEQAAADGRAGGGNGRVGDGGVPARRPRERRRYGMAELEALTALNPRTIRYYVSQGLLPPAYGRGPTATYDESHLLRLRAIKELKEAHLRLEEIKARLNDLSDDELATLVAVEAVPAAERALWRRIDLHPDVELHIRERAGGDRNLAFEQKLTALVAAAKGILAPAEEER